MSHCEIVKLGTDKWEKDQSLYNELRASIPGPFRASVDILAFATCCSSTIVTIHNAEERFD